MNEYLKTNNLGNYYKYNKVIIRFYRKMIYRSIIPFQSFFDFLHNYILILKNASIVSNELELENIELHQIKIFFRLIPWVLFCKTTGFNKGKNNFYSKDYREYKRIVFAEKKLKEYKDHSLKL